MSNKRSAGLTIASLLSIVFFGYSVLFFIFLFPPEGSPWFIILRYTICLAVSILGFIVSLFVFDLRRWSRKIIIYSCLFFLGLTVITDISYLIMCKWFGVQGLFNILLILFNPKRVGLYAFWFILIVFLTRPQVKAQFK